jgi:hypothetical protein
MTRRAFALVPVLVLMAVVAAAPAPAFNRLASDAAAALAAGQPVKCAPGDVTVDGRVFPEPTVSAGFLRLVDFECGMRLLEQTYPDRIEMVSLGKSRAGHDVWDIRMTDRTVDDEGKERLLVVNSIHGNEIGAREGAARMIEDMLDPELDGDEEWVAEVLRTHVIHWNFPNPDGWVSGDIYGSEGAGLAWTRANDGRRDLNRNFPVSGWIAPANGPLDQPESVLVDDMLRSFDGWSLGTDNHGQIMQPEQPTAASGLQIVGQFDYQKSETLARFGDAINDAMAEYGVLQALEALNEGTGNAVAPYRWGTLYDILGYSASGSLIDYYNTFDGIGGTGFATELSISNHQAANAAVPMQVLNQIWVDSVRAINSTMFQQAIDPVEFTFPLGGDVAYVYDPAVVTSAVGVGFAGEPEHQERWGQADYEVTRMRFFRDLDEHASGPVTPLLVEEILADPSVLDGYDSVILSDEVMPGEGSLNAWVAALDDYVHAGGNLVLLDGAARILESFGLVPEGAVSRELHYVGAVADFTDRSHPLNAGLRGIASQTYDTVPIGYRFGSNAASHSAPNWKVTQEHWEAAGGFTAGTNGSGKTIYGELPLGSGKITFLGALLPQPTEDFYHPFGLQNYAVTYTGYTLLENMLAYARP